jgi:hypothetical protein
MNPWEMLLDQQAPSNYIAPLFWQHGESESVLREEVRKMHEGGIGGCIIESRPHPDYMGPRWWHDLDVILDEAGKLGMKVWLFDDKDYPSGFAAGLIRDTHPEFLKIYLAEKHVDAIGPLSGSSFFIQPWLGEGDRLVRVIAAKQVDRGDELDGNTFCDLTALVSDGVLYWDVPDGAWRVFVLFSTRSGGEEHTRDYLNPLEAAPVKAYLDLIYEEHYRHYASHFGKTLAGFFTDEPRFGSMASYKAPLGTKNMVLPFSQSLLAQLDAAWGGDFGLLLPCLWYDTSEHFNPGKRRAAEDEEPVSRLSARARYTFMDTVSRLFGQNFLGQMGDWCRAHGVKLIGHVVEENGAHARVGYGAGHFFRAMQGLDAAGVDVVYHLWPEYTQGTVSWGGMTEWDAEFAYWGMIKMASSAAHIDPKKNGLTVCEAFGAYGWQEGLKLMKWITDHLAARGVNFMIPHAFSPKQQDPDCPPHMYARGLNPQWKYYHLLSEYTNRVFHLLSGGVHVAPVAVLYHADAEWAGGYEPFEHAVHILAEDQIDCDILPVDVLVDPQQLRIDDGCFLVNREAYKALVVPQAERLPQSLLKVLVSFINHNIPVVFTGELPIGGSQNVGGFEALLEELRASPNTAICEFDLVEHLRYLGVTEIETSEPAPSLRVLHYIQDAGWGDLASPLYFLTNESRLRTVSTTLTLAEKGVPVGYDPLSDRIHCLDYTADNGKLAIQLELEPYESLFILFQPENEAAWKPRLRPAALSKAVDLSGGWQVASASAPDGSFAPEPRVSGLGNVAKPGVLPRFSGTLRYTTTFDVAAGTADSPALLDLGAVYEIAEVTLNGKNLGARICPPYRFEVSGLLRAGANTLQVDVTNTLAKAWGSQNPFDRSMPQEPTGLVGPVCIRQQTVASGY